MPDRAKAYSKEKHRIAIINIILTAFILILLVVLKAPAYLRVFSMGVSGNSYINLFIFSFLMSVLYSIAASPLVYYAGFVLEHKYSLSNQTLKSWIKQELKKGTVSFIIAIPLIFSLYAFIRYRPSAWWFFTALVWFSMSVLVAKFAPVVIVPLFYKYSPIKNTQLKDRLIVLAARANFKTKGVYEINTSKDTKKANAALMGMGKEKRIVLCDTLFGNFNEDEIVSIMGHELGHHKKSHIVKLILSGGISTLAIFFLTDIAFLRFHSILGYKHLYDFESLVLIYAIIYVLNILALPVHNLFSRKLEEEADMFALKLTGNKNAFISTMRKLAGQNLADPDPGRFYEIMLYNHPPIAKRISFAESFTGEK